MIGTAANSCEDERTTGNLLARCLKAPTSFASISDQRGARGHRQCLAFKIAARSLSGTPRFDAKFVPWRASERASGTLHSKTSQLEVPRALRPLCQEKNLKRCKVDICGQKEAEILGTNFENVTH